MRDELQRIVDGVAARLGRPALVEDRRHLVLAYSAHTGPTDRVRRASILHRHAAPEVVAWLAAAGLAQAYAPVRTPACAQLGLLPRVCVPLRYEELLLGFLWFIDADPGLTDAELVEAAGLAEDLTLTLYRENLLGELAGGWEAEAARAVLADDGPTRRRAARALAEEGVVAGDAPTTAVVAQLAGGADRHPGEGARMALEQALVATRRWCGPRAALHLVRRDHGVLLLTGTRAAGQPCPRAAARHLDEALLAAVREPDRTGGAAIGIGGTRTGLSEAFASYAEARQAARVGGRLPAFGRVVSWAELGVYRVLSRLAPGGAGDGGPAPDGAGAGAGEVGLGPGTGAGVHPGLERLLGDAEHRVLVDTLETYLDLAGNAHATAQRLRLHRTTLYYRLRRLEELAGTDLKDGGERLCLHLALKLSRLADPSPAPRAGSGPGP